MNNNIEAPSNLVTTQPYSNVYRYRDAYFINKEMPSLGDKSHDIINIDQICGTEQKTVLENFNYKQVFLLLGNLPNALKYLMRLNLRALRLCTGALEWRNWQNCKKSQKIDAMSIQEEIEQDLINCSVVVDTEKCKTIAKLPFVTDPDFRLRPNEKIALKIYEGQVRALSNKTEDKKDVMESEGKSQDLGFVDFVHNLPKEDRDLILTKPKYFIPWRAVWKPNSLSTPCRLVLDASCCSRGVGVGGGGGGAA